MKIPLEVNLKRTAHEFSTDKLKCMEISGQLQDAFGDEGETTESEQDRMNGGQYGQTLTFD